MGLMLWGCQPAVIPFQQAAPDTDKQTVPHPPSEEELRIPPHFLAFSPPVTNPQLTQYHQSLSLNFIQSLLEQEGNLQILPEYRTTYLLQRIEFREYDPTSVEDAFRLGKALKVDYIAMLKIQPSLVKKDDLDWATYPTLKIYQVQSQQIVMQESFNFEALHASNLWNTLKTKVQKVFPLKGYILETRNRHAYVRINFGTNQGIRANRTCSVFRRSIESKTLPDGGSQKTESYQLLGKMTIREVNQDTSWGVVDPETRPKILTGDVVFTNPE